MHLSFAKEQPSRPAEIRRFLPSANYLTDRRAAVRNDPRNLLGSARSIVCAACRIDVTAPGRSLIACFSSGVVRISSRFPRVR